MKKLYTLLILLSTLGLVSCIDDIEIDTQEGPQLVGINGYISNEYKKHQVVISRTADFYSNEEIEMVSGAEVFISDGSDTIYFKETNEKGYYETIDSVAGIIGKTYKLNVTFIDDEGEHYYYAESTMRENVEKIDSLIIKDFTLGNMELPALGLYPYFQSVTNPETSYLVNVKVNDSLYNESLIRCQSLLLAGFSGGYVNGPDMTALIGEQAVYYFWGVSYNNPETSTIEMIYPIEKGDEITMYLYSITPEFNNYISDINSNFGSNPMIGMPYNVSTNIHPQGKAVGFFEAYSSMEHTVIY